MAILDDVKLALRITHTKLDEDLRAKINAAKKDLISLGVDETKVNSDADPLIVEAIKTYMQYKYSRDDKEMENYYNSWVVQVDKLRKTAGYGYAVEESSEEGSDV